jgi:hypothetical protein
MAAKTTRMARPEAKPRKPVGGKRTGAGRKKGSGTVRMSGLEAIELARQGESPLEYMLRVMRTTDADLLALEKRGHLDTAERIKLQADRDKRRDWASQAAAPYVHPRLSAVDVTESPDQSKSEEDNILPYLTDEELDALHVMLSNAEQRARNGVKPPPQH